MGNNDSMPCKIDDFPGQKHLVESPSLCYQPEGYRLDIKPNIKQCKSHIVKNYSDGSDFPLQLEGTENNGIYNIMYLRQIETDHVPAIIIQDEDAETPTFCVYAFKPLFEGQRAVHRDSYSSSVLYEWARVQQKVGWFGHSSFHMWTRQNYKAPAYVAKPVDSPTSIALRMGGLSFTPHEYKVMRDDKICATVQGKVDANANWQLHIGAGQDPALFLCFVAVLDVIFVGEWKRRLRVAEEM